MSLLLNILYSYIKSAYRILLQNNKVTKQLINELNTHLSIYDRELDKKTIQRIYFSTKLSAATNLWFATLRGKKTTVAENKLAVYVGALTPIADDLIDELNWSTQEILIQAEVINEHSSTAVILLNYLKNKLKIAKNKQFTKALEKTINAQNRSILQTSANTLSQSELKNITYDKGGSSTYLYRTILFNSLIINEKDAIYSLGYVLQLINDMFDLHKDYHSKQQSLFTTNNDIDVPIAAYNSAIDDFILKFGKLSYPKEFKMQFFNLIAIILGRGHVCRDMLLNLAKSSKKKDLREMDRHLLICDMEKATNIYKSINLSYKLGKRFNAEIL